MKTKYIVKVIFLVMIGGISFLSCTKAPYSIPKDVLAVLDMAGSNQEELLKVLNHYNSKNDSLKFDAACYLIANMPMHEATYHTNANRIDFVLESIGKVSSNKRAMWDSLGTFLSRIDVQELEVRKDVEFVNSEFLIENIEYAFHAWQTFPWCKNVSFDDFKTYILPYRSSNEPLVHFRKKMIKQFSWLEDSMQNKTDNLEAFAYIYNDFLAWFETTSGNKYPIPMNFDQLLLAKGGSCNDECNLLNAIMKSMGIVNVIDHVDYWANRNSGHTWVAALDSAKNPLIMDKYTRFPARKEYLHSGFFPLDSPGTSCLPDYLYVTEYKTAAKVVRKTFTSHKEIGKSAIYREPEHPFRKDVSQLYLITKDVSISVEDNLTPYYLCLFDNDQLLPIASDISRNGTVTFKDMGVKVLYIITSLDKGNLIPVTPPFILQSNGSKHYLQPGTKETELTLYRKYPLFGNILNYANYVHGGVFQGADNPDFKNPVNLLTIDCAPIDNVILPATPHKAFRYLRFLPDPNTNGDIAEITFFSGNKKLTGDVLYKHAGIGSRSPAMAFDGKLNTYYRGDSSNTWIGLDLGKERNSTVTDIGLCPRSDTNFILIGNTYSLYTWNSGWKLFASKTAQSASLEFDKIPEGGLFWLHCENGGKEERPFSYENGKQVWW